MKKSSKDIPIVMADGETADIREVMGFPPFQRWMSNLQTGHEVGDWNIERFIIQRSVRFGGACRMMDDGNGHVVRIGPGRIGMLLVQAVGLNKDGTPLNGVAFLRGDSVAILPILRDEQGRTWTVVTEQPRLAVGDARYMEIPAGMMDGHDLKSKALEELKEEVGPEFNVEEHELIQLGCVHASPGGSDEMLHFVAFEREVTSEFLDMLSNRLSGLREEGESIRIHITPLAELEDICPHDMKARMAISMWRAYEFKRTLDLMAPPEMQAEVPEGTLPFKRP
jgi:ADP-sugar diphosphatase